MAGWRSQVVQSLDCFHPIGCFHYFVAFIAQNSDHQLTYSRLVIDHQNSASVHSKRSTYATSGYQPRAISYHPAMTRVQGHPPAGLRTSGVSVPHTNFHCNPTSCRGLSHPQYIPSGSRSWAQAGQRPYDRGYWEDDPSSMLK